PRAPGGSAEGGSMKHEAARCVTTLALSLLAFASAPRATPAPSSGLPADWTAAQAPFRIVGDVYDVGTRDLAVYLITTPKGDVLIDGALEQTVPQIEQHIESLGARLTDIK